MRIIILIIMMSCTLLNSVLCADPVLINQDEGSIYAYRDDDAPEVFFFPKEKARWDGSKVTMSEWYMLTDLQKQKFIEEYIEELKKQYNSALEVVGLDYMVALNLFSYYSNDNAASVPTSKFINMMLKAQGKIAGS